jgi:hypothetical protein
MDNVIEVVALLRKHSELELVTLHHGADGQPFVRYRTDNSFGILYRRLSTGGKCRPRTVISYAPGAESQRAERTRSRL